MIKSISLGRMNFGVLCGGLFWFSRFLNSISLMGLLDPICLVVATIFAYYFYIFKKCNYIFKSNLERHALSSFFVILRNQRLMDNAF